MKAHNQDVEIAWEEVGAGDPLLLVQGLGYGRWGWEPLVEPLAERFRVITFDNRGIGESTVPDGPYSAAQMATDARAVLDAAEAEEAHVVGSSLGGMIAQELALTHPERVDHLVLIASHPGAPHGYPMPEVTVRLLSEAQSLAPEEALRRFVVNALGPEPDASVVEEIVARRLANPPDPTGWQGQAAAGTTYEGGDRAREITAPTLVVTGKADRVVDPRNGPLLTEMIGDSTLHEIPGGGHLVFWEHPDRVADLMVEFLS